MRLQQPWLGCLGAMFVFVDLTSCFVAPLCATSQIAEKASKIEDQHGSTLAGGLQWHEQIQTRRVSSSRRKHGSSR